MNRQLGMDRRGRNRGLVVVTALFGVVALLVMSPRGFAGERAADLPSVPRFATDVVPVLTKLGCNGGGCHGKATGQNGFRLSLLGFEPELDHQWLVRESRGRRLFPASPERSLLLLKATAQLPHGGGRRLEETSADYLVLRDWIAAGSPGPSASDPRLVGIAVEPQRRVMTRDARLALVVTARFSDGTLRDVTQRAVYQSNEPDLAAVDEAGVVHTKNRSGQFAIMARYGDQIATFEGAVPFVHDDERRAAVDRQLDQLAEQLADSPVDRLLLAQWRRLSIVPSAPVDDATFLRRVTLDLCGTLPTQAEVVAYLEDRSADKRARLVERLLRRPEYASYFGLKWADILQNRGAGYSTSQQRASTARFAAWIRDSFAANKPYDQFVAELLTATGNPTENPATLWYRTVRKPQESVEAVAQAFLGIRIQCAQCHHHPAENWSQADYFGLAASFARLGRKGGFADAEVPTDETLFLKDHGETLHPRTGERLSPKPLGGAEFTDEPYVDPRRQLAQWLTAPENPYFARTMANRLWAHFLGRGIVHPVDDRRSSNPPTNPELLDALAQELVSSGYDIQHLIRVITSSYAYRLSAMPEEGNRGDQQSFARFYPRRLPAEVLLDGFSQALDVPTEFPGGPGKFPAGQRAIDLPDENIAAHFLDVFGRPARMSACECERVDAPALAQALELVSSAEIQRKLVAPSGFARRIADDPRPLNVRVSEVFLRVLGRQPTADEARDAREFLATAPDQAAAFRSFVWSLLATNEFLFNH